MYHKVQYFVITDNSNSDFEFFVIKRIASHCYMQKLVTYLQQLIPNCL